jgi:hypothetical protein
VQHPDGVGGVLAPVDPEVEAPLPDHRHRRGAAGVEREAPLEIAVDIAEVVGEGGGDRLLEAGGVKDLPVGIRGAELLLEGLVEGPAAFESGRQYARGIVPGRQYARG